MSHEMHGRVAQIGLLYIKLRSRCWVASEWVDVGLACLFSQAPLVTQNQWVWTYSKQYWAKILL